MFTLSALGMLAALTTGCQAAPAKKEPAPDYEAVRRRAGEAHEDVRLEETGGKRPVREGPSRPAAPEPEVRAPAPSRPPAERKGAKPDWVDSTSAQYPRSQYLTGVGIADERPSAQDRSRGEISKIFSTLVTVNTDISASETDVTVGKKTENAFTQSVSQSVQTASRKALEGVEIAELWQDPASRSFYALAVLERAKAILAITDKIGEFDRQAQELKNQLDTATEKLPKVKAALRLADILKARAELNSELRVLEESGKAVPAPFDEAAVRSSAAKAISELNVVVSMSGESSKAVETGVIQGLTKFGLQAASGAAGPAADIVVEGQLQTDTSEIEDGKWKRAQSTLTLSLKDGRTGNTFVQFDVTNRKDATTNFKDAVRRSHQDLAKKVAQEISAGITSYFENQ